MAINWKRLADFFDPEDLEWKPVAVSKKTGKALAAAYVTARAIQERLDEVFGVGGWKNEYRAGPDGGVVCRIYFKNDDGEWVWREDGAENTDIESIKGGLSNALKRAGSALGIGRYLYQLPQAWTPVDDYGKFKETPRIPREFLPGASTKTRPQPAPDNPPSRDGRLDPATEEILRKIEEAGRSIYGSEWESKKIDLANASSGGRTSDLSKLELKEAQPIYRGLMKMSTEA